MEIADLGRTLLAIGGGIFILGLLLTLAGNVPFLGKVPGDISFQWGNLRVFFPLATMLILSILLTVILNVLGGWFRR